MRSAQQKPITTEDSKMTTFLERGYRFRSGAVRYRDLAYVLCIDPNLERDKLPHTAFYVLDVEEWGMFDIGRWNARSICIVQQPKEQAIALGEHGNVRIMGNGDDYDEQIICPGTELSILREVRAIGGFAYACGMDRQVFKRRQRGDWVALHGNMPAQPAIDIVFGFESIHGFSEQDIHAVGWHGEIWHFDGQTWQPCDSPTNINLTRVHCADDGWAYACGMHGTLLRGRQGNWEVIEHEATGADFWGLEWFDGRLYLSTQHNLFVLNGNALELVDMGEDVPGSCHHLSAADGVLWSIGADDILSFDGSRWTRIA